MDVVDENQKFRSAAVGSPPVSVFRNYFNLSTNFTQHDPVCCRPASDTTAFRRNHCRRAMRLPPSLLIESVSWRWIFGSRVRTGTLHCGRTRCLRVYDRQTGSLRTASNINFYPGSYSASSTRKRPPLNLCCFPWPGGVYCCCCPCDTYRKDGVQHVCRIGTKRTCVPFRVHPRRCIYKQARSVSNLPIYSNDTCTVRNDGIM